MPPVIETLEDLRREMRARKGLLGGGLEHLTRVGLGIAETLEPLGRPWGAAVEAYGATEAGEDPYQAAKRILTEGTQKARYPTIGERVVPEEEGEGLGRGLARVGVELATDPTFYFGPGIARGVIGAGIKGAKAGAKLTGVTKAATALGKSDFGQQVARVALPLTANWEKYGGKWGPKAARRLGLSNEFADSIIDQERLGLIQAVNRFKLGGAKNLERRQLAARMLEDPSVYTADEAVVGLRDYLRSRFDDLGRMVQTFVDEKGNPIRILQANGERIPFEMIENYFPRMLREEYLAQSLTRSGLAKQAANLAKQLKITESEAKQILMTQTGRIKRAGHIEHARLPVEIPDEIREWDPLLVFPRYVNQTARRLGAAKYFGEDLSIFDRLARSAEAAGLSDATIRETRNLLQGKREFAKWGLDNVAPTVLGWQVLSKMGPTSTIANMSQPANTIIAHGVGNFGKGVYRLMTDQGLRQRSLQSFHAGLRQQMEALLGPGGDSQALLGRWLSPNTYLRGVGFTPVERVNRVTAYAGGLAQLERMARDAPKLTKELRRLGLNQNEFTVFKATGKFAPEVEKRLGIAAANRTQFTSSWTDLPPLWQSPEMRMVVQFRNFIYHQTRFLLREVMNPAIRYFETGGKEGTIRPLTRALVAYPIAGQGVAALRDLMAEQSARLVGAKRRRPRKFDYNHPVKQMLEDSFYVGSFGMAGDVLQQAARGRLLQWAFGPTASDLAELGEFAGKHIMEPALPSGEAVARQLYRHVPGRRILPLQPQEFVGAAQRWF